MRTAFTAGSYARAAADTALRIDEHRFLHSSFPPLNFTQTGTLFSVAKDRQFTRMDPFYTCRAGLEFGDLRCRVEFRIGQKIDRDRIAPMVWNEDRVRPNGPDDQRRKYTFAPTRNDLYGVAVVYFEFCRSFGMDLNIRLGALIDEKFYSPSLIT